ncbi:hypothetical protein M3215_01440 [Bacillus cytotoxicus]|uniref:Uncharacterized protein n=1 Tax=Bacillus cytotoxicus TaxID=580165 RepID=A0ACC6A1S7_9BACI|nr:hypothetical protein [Bacillus cytotoxicus]
MNIRMERALPIASFTLHYDGNMLFLDNVLLDTGCATTIFDTDVLADVGIELDVMNGKPKRMYGVGGYMLNFVEESLNRVEAPIYCKKR